LIDDGIEFHGLPFSVRALAVLSKAYQETPLRGWPPWFSPQHLAQPHHRSNGQGTLGFVEIQVL